MSGRDDEALGTITTGQVEAGVAQFTRQAAVATRTHTHVADCRLGRSTRTVVETRVRYADARDLLAPRTAVIRRANAAKRAAETVVARGAVYTRSTGAGVVLVLTPFTAKSSQADAHALLFLGHEARAAVEAVVSVVACAVSANIDKQGLTGAAVVARSLLAPLSGVRRPADARESGAVVRRLAESSVSARIATARLVAPLAVRAFEARPTAARRPTRRRAEPRTRRAVEADDGTAASN